MCGLSHRQPQKGLINTSVPPRRGCLSPCPEHLERLSSVVTMFSPGLGFICNVPHISHAHKAGGKGGGAGKRPLPVVPGLGVEAMFASPARQLAGPPWSPRPPDRTGVELERERKPRGEAPHASFIH